jgi:hypothetical protein
MQPYFTNLNVECWKHNGKLGFSPLAICLYHDRVESGRAILTAIDELSAEPPPAKRTITIRPSPRKKCITTLRLLLVEPRDDLRAMHIAYESGAATIELTTIGLAALREAIDCWCNGGEDFGVSPSRAEIKKREFGALDKSSGELWFWGPTMGP